MNRIVVSDTTAITHLAKIGALDILRKLYVEIKIPEAVLHELGNAKKTQPGALEVLNASWITVVKIKDQEIADKLRKRLDLGESEAIALSIELKADLLIIDEAAGRQTAKAMNLKIIGMVGVLIEAKKKGIIPSIKPYIEALRKTGFFLGDDIYKLALRLARESATG